MFTTHGPGAADNLRLTNTVRVFLYPRHTSSCVLSDETGWFDLSTGTLGPERGTGPEHARRHNQLQ
jgi:hypothetical protein